MIDFISHLARFTGALARSLVRAVSITLARQKPPPERCDDPGTAPCGTNPRICGSSEAVVFDPTGNLAQYAACGQGPRTQLRSQGGFSGLDSAARAELRFAPAPLVTIRLVHFSNPGRIEARQSGSVVDVRMMATTPGIEQSFTLNGTAIDRLVVIPASPTDVTLILGWCH